MIEIKDIKLIKVSQVNEFDISLWYAKRTTNIRRIYEFL